MPDRIYVTYSPTIALESYHTAIHYERTDAVGNLLEHTIIDATPQRGNALNPLEKMLGAVEEFSTRHWSVRF